MQSCLIMLLASSFCLLFLQFDHAGPLSAYDSHSLIYTQTGLTFSPHLSFLFLEKLLHFSIPRSLTLWSMRNWRDASRNNWTLTHLWTCWLFSMRNVYYLKLYCYRSEFLEFVFYFSKFAIVKLFAKTKIFLHIDIFKLKCSILKAFRVNASFIRDKDEKKSQ